MMALLAFSNFPSLASFTYYYFPNRNNNNFNINISCCCLSSSAAAKTGIVWFKHDLRIHDHPALSSASASNFHSLLPIYVFDHRILSRFDDEMLQLLLFGVQDLRNSFMDRGSNLMIRFGHAPNVLLQIATQVRAYSVFAEQEVEYQLCCIIHDVIRHFKSKSAPHSPSPTLHLCNTPFYHNIKCLQNLPASYHDFKKLQLPVTTPPLHIPTLPAAPFNLDWGALPGFDDVKKFMTANQRKPREKNWNAIKETSAETLLRNEIFKSGKSSERSYNSFRQMQSRRPKESVFGTQRGNAVCGGTNNVLNALAAYLKYTEGTTRDDWQEVHEKLLLSENRNGASFIGLFGPALSLGIISRRRVHYEAIKYEKERNAGFLSPFGYSAATIAAAIDSVCSKEWYWLMALRNQMNNDGINSVRIWRWNGFLIQYTVSGDDGPAVLLVHGFGAFWEHYRDNINGLVEAGNRVWAITMLGFGKSEKPNVVYTELLWAELLRDFIVDVVGEPVHLVGNSIGGYIVAIAVRIWSVLIKSIVLINSAGNVIPGHTSISLSRDRQTSSLSWLGSRIILFYLRLRIQEIVKKCYPTRMERADDWLINEMLRASLDPGVPVVLESIFSFNLSIPLNYLLQDVKDKVLIIQGMKDPISDSYSKVAMLKEHCDGVVIKELDAGHCPHDEVPELVNTIIGEWILSVERNILAGYQM